MLWNIQPFGWKETGLVTTRTSLSPSSCEETAAAAETGLIRSRLNLKSSHLLFFKCSYGGRSFTYAGRRTKAVLMCTVFMKGAFYDGCTVSKGFAVCRGLCWVTVKVKTCWKCLSNKQTFCTRAISHVLSWAEALPDLWSRRQTAASNLDSFTAFLFWHNKLASFTLQTWQGWIIYAEDWKSKGQLLSPSPDTRKLVSSL